MIRRYPNIFGLSIGDNIEPKLDWLQKRLSLNDSELSNFVQKFPSLLNFNVDTNIEPTLNFYIDALGDEDQALNLVIRRPALISLSLENRLKPRLQEAQDYGMTIDSGCLTRIGSYTNKQWSRSLAKY